MGIRKNVLKTIDKKSAANESWAQTAISWIKIEINITE